jgi:hypothetical protein
MAEPKTTNNASDAGGSGTYYGNKDQVQVYISQLALQYDLEPPVLMPVNGTPPPSARQLKWNRMKAKTQERYRLAWRIYKQMCNEYKEDVLDSKTQKAKPRIQDLRVRLADRTDWQVSERTLSEVIAFGRAGVIK